MQRQLTQRDEAVLTDALSAPSTPLPGRVDERALVVTTVEVDVEPGRRTDPCLVGTAQVWLRHAGLAARRVGEHVLALHRGPDLEATALKLSAPDQVAGLLVGHAMVRLAAGDVARVRGRGSPPGGHPAWADVLGWDPDAAEHNRDELAAAMGRGCRAYLDEGRHPAHLVALVGELRRAVQVSWVASLSRPELFGDPGGNEVAVRRFWRRVIARVSPSDLAAMGPVLDGGEHLGAWVLGRGQAEWAGVHEFSEMGARLARAMRRADLRPGFANDLDPGPIGA